MDEDQTKLIEIVSRESERLNKLVSDFLLYSRDQRHEFQKVDLVKVIEETLVLLAHHPLFGRNVRVEKQFSTEAIDSLGRRRQAAAGLLEYLRQRTEGHAGWGTFDSAG